MIKIKKAKVQQAQEIRRLEDKIWGEEVVNIYDIATFITFGYVFVAEDNGKIIGAICAFKTKNDEIYLSDWVVEKKYQGIGIGLKLFKKLEQEIGGGDIVSYVNLGNDVSITAHKKLGFKAVRKLKDPYGLKKDDCRILFRRKTVS